jgi:ketosteroid isomerase-like protein
MRFTRRHLALAGALALGTSSLLLSPPSAAQSTDEASVVQAVEALRKAMLDADRARLEDLTADQLSYGHSGGTIQTKDQFVNVIVRKETIYKSITLSDPVTTIAGNNAIVRHVFSAETESDGKPSTAKVGVMQVWQKQDGRWKLLARQAFKI